MYKFIFVYFFIHLFYMFFYLIKNSSILKNKDNEDSLLFTIALYGIVMYISFHALVNISFSDASLFNTYFWTLLFIDIGSMYYIYYSDKNGEVTIQSNITEEKQTEPIVNKEPPVVDDFVYEEIPIEQVNFQPKVQPKVQPMVQPIVESTNVSSINKEIKIVNDLPPQTTNLNDDDILSMIQNNHNINTLEKESERIVNEKFNNLGNENETETETDIEINMSDFENLLD